MIKTDTHEELHPNEAIEIKQARRLLLNDAVLQYLNAGGKITTVAPGESGKQRAPGMQPMVYGDAPGKFRR